MPVLPLRPALLSILAVMAASANVAPFARAQAEAPAVTPPSAVPLKTGWQFRTDPQDFGLTAGWRTGAWADAWADVQVPHVFNATPVDAEFLGTVGWYRLRLQTPPTPAGFGWALYFEGARRKATVWLNGRRLARHTNPYEAFVVPAKGMRRSGEVNDLVVRVDNRRSPDLREGWWNWGGLTRRVTLVPVGKVSWDDLGILSDVKCAETCSAIARTDGMVSNHTNQTVSPVLTVALTSPSGEVTTKTVTVRALRPFERRRVGFPIDIQGRPHLWSPKHPELYSGTVTVALGDTVTHTEQRKVGLRFVRVQDGALYLNGHRLQLRGASIQEDLPSRGPALRDEDVDTIVADLKALGANVTRAQYPLDERLLTRLDQEGILVWSQSPVYHEDEALKTKLGRAEAIKKVRHTVLLARNHPSVMTHSVANELSPYADSMPGTRLFLLRAARTTRDLDDTVPAALDLLSYPNIPRQRAYAAFGLLGINSYYGWYRGKRGAQSTARLEDLEPFLASMRRKYPRQAQMITEFGAEATFKGPAAVKETFAFQSRYVDRTLSIVKRQSWLSGAIYWTAREFFVKPNWDGGALRDVERDALHNKGLISYGGKPKPAFYEARRLFSQTPIYRGE